MSVFFEVNALEKDINDRNFDIRNRIANVRKLLLIEENNQLLPNEIKAISLFIWNITVKLQRLLPYVDASNNSLLRSSIIPSMRILSADIFQKNIDKSDNNDVNKLFYILSYTFKSLLDSNNIQYADQYLNLAISTYSQLNFPSEEAEIFVQLALWQAQFEISQNNDLDKALAILMEFTSHYKIESTFLISFIYKNAIENQSFEWMKYCLSLIDSSSSIPNEWKTQVEFLLAQFYIINNEPEESKKLITNLPNSLNKLYLELKCCILHSSNEDNLKERLISFISQAKENQNLINDLCVFVANQCNKIGQISLDFIKEVMNSVENITNTEIKKHIFVSAIQISCELDDINTTSIFLNIIDNFKDMSNNDTKEYSNEISSILWNKALDMFDINEYEKSAQWMQFSRFQMNESDNISQSCCLRHICRCFFEAKKYKEAIESANDAIHCDPSCSHGYLHKFRIFVKMEKQSEAYEFIDGIIDDSPYIGEFEPSFFTSIASELHSIGNDNLALKTLLKLYELNFNSNGIDNSAIQATILKKIKKSTINSIFALLQDINDIAYVSRAINILSSRWNKQVIYQIINQDEIEHSKDTDSLLLFFTSSEITSYVSVAYQNGLDLKSKSKWKKAINSFISGSLFSGDLIECKALCVFEAVDCYINLMNLTENSAPDKKICTLSSDSPLLQAKKIVDEVTTEIEVSTNIEKNYKDGLLLAKIKISLIMMKIQYSKEHFDQVVRLIRLIESQYLLFEVIQFICKYKVPKEIIINLLDVAKKIDNTSKRNDMKANSISASILYQLVNHSKTLEETRNSYEIVIGFLSKEENSSLLIKPSQLQFFMSHAWNTGVQCAKSLRSKDAEWWFKTALSIIDMSDVLKSQYEEELNEKYLQFLVHNKNRIAFSF